MRPSKPKYENNLCNSNKFIKSQQIVKSVENGPACNGNNKNSNKNFIVLFRGGAWAKIMIIPIGQLLPAWKGALYVRYLMSNIMHPNIICEKTLSTIN